MKLKIESAKATYADVAHNCVDFEGETFRLDNFCEGNTLAENNEEEVVVTLLGLHRHRDAARREAKAKAHRLCLRLSIERGGRYRFAA